MTASLQTPTPVVFDAYAAYYDLLYADKDYDAESDYIHDLIQRYQPTTRTVLELGSGTGRHALLLAERGYHIQGVELSTSMLELAGRHCLQASLDVRERVAFSVGDLRTVKLGRTFDCVLSLFHVISYQVSNEDLKAAFRTIREHLSPGGIAIFDFWYGPAVLAQRPSVRVMRKTSGDLSVTRIAEPDLDTESSICRVNYEIFIGRDGDRVDVIHETHPMRYLFMTELDLLLEQSQMVRVASQGWLTDSAPSEQTWGACVVVKAL